MKAALICPGDRPAVSQLAEFGPLAAIPVLGDALVCHWVEHLAFLGARSVQIVAPEGADSVRSAVGNGARWGISVEVVATRVEPTREEAQKLCAAPAETNWLPAPHDIVFLSHLPGSPDLPLFESNAAWYSALAAWMPRALTPARVRMTQQSPGIWVGCRSRVSKTARLTAPCWIGDLVSVGDGASVGPGAIIDDRSVVDAGARVTRSWIGPDTFVGSMTAVSDSLAWGATLTNWQTDSTLFVPDPFLLSSLLSLPPPAADRRAARAVDGARPSLSFLSALRARLARGLGPKAARTGGA